MRRAFTLLFLVSCASDPVRPDAGVIEDAAALDAGFDPDASVIVPLTANAGPSRYALAGVPIELDGSASTGAVAYQWSFGDGEGWSTPRAEAIATVTYAEPGRYSAVLTVFDAGGARKTAAAIITVTHALVHTPASSATIIALAGDRVAVVSPDSNEVAVLEGDQVARRLPTSRNPRTLAAWRSKLVVACQDDDAVSVLDPAGVDPPQTISLRYGARPYGIVARGDSVFVALAGSGELVELAGESLDVVHIWSAVEDARGVALLPDGRVAVTRWRSPDARAEVAAIDPRTGVREVWTLAVDPQLSSDTEIGGVPSYLNQLVVSPNGVEAAIPSLQANIADGAYRNGRLVTHETTVRAIVSFVSLPSGVERFELRKQFDDRGFASAAVFSSHGDYLFLAMPGSRAVERFDLLSNTQAGTLLDVGWAPAGVALSGDDRRLYVDAYLSREVVIYDVGGEVIPLDPIARVAITESEPLSPAVLRGKQIFNDALDPRITRSGYIACAHCHLDGDSDLRVWDFTQRGEGYRNTISLLGRAGLGHGPLHWSASFDEVQDFEHDIRGAFLGTGLMSDAEFQMGTRDETLGDPKAGVSAELDALALYVGSLAAYPRSPVRTSTGALTASARRGKIIFESAATACTTCHRGVALTDSAIIAPRTPRLHDVGTATTSSGNRLGLPLTGLDTPTLHALFSSAPYLHDGSAPTVADTLRDDRHGTTSQLSAAERADLVDYLLSLDGRRD